ncbi:flagellar hook-length control protein FliK [Rhabdaerophilum calidifontis]|uniref:flagellar hook-length control protein FliK n=1 Tax=Rhabdaerophilum calidifontis TaxID=2604328 RepID=UPI001239230D|nr:flagellar hook-length control protein FliK [Rhabdaerophilum calidifontis]
MSSEVSLSLANALTDLITRRAGEKPATPENDSAPGGGGTAQTTFGMLVRETAGAEGAREARRPIRARPDERLMPGELPRPQRPEPESRPGARAEDRPAQEARPQEARPEPARSKDRSPLRETDAPRAPSDDETARDAAGEAAEEPAASEAVATEAGETGPAKGETAAAEGEVVADAAGTGETVAADPAATAAEALLIAAAPVKTDPVAAAASATAGTDGSEGPAAAPALVAAAASEPAAEKIAAGTPAGTGLDAPARPGTAAAKAATAGEAAPAAMESAAGEDTAKTAAATPVTTAAGKTGAQGAATEAGKAAKPAQPNLHPVRTSPFAEILESFHSGSIHRPADILAGLERNAAPQAQRAETVSRPTPLQMLPIEIGMQAVRGATQFQIRLDPAELGRIDVQLQIKENGEVNANLVVDRVETLAMLRRDASTLQQAFEQAGLRQSSDGLSFSLRGEGQQGESRQGSGQPGRQDALDEAALANLASEVAMRRVMIPNASIDRMI